MPFVEMPKLSDTMTEGTLVKWRKAVGDIVEPGDVVAEVETDKAVMELEAFASGTLSQIYVAEGGKARIGERLARLSGPGEERPLGTEQPLPTPPVTAEPNVPSAAAPLPSETAPVAPPPSGGRVKASPLAKKIAATKGIDLTSVTGSGPGGRIVGRDVETAAASKPAGPPTAPVPAQAPLPEPILPPASGDKRIPMSGMRRIIADRLLASKTQIPHFYLNVEVDAGELVRLRAQLNAATEKAGLGKFTLNDFILRATVMAATRVPRVNASYAGDAIIEYANVHLAVAVAVEEGLMTPVIRGAQKKSLREISEAVKDLATRARSKKIKPEEYQGGTLTVSNLGAYGIASFQAVINPPQAVILSVGALVPKPVVNGAGEIVVGERLALGLSADHRVVDGAIGAQFLKELRQLLENPTLLLI